MPLDFPIELPKDTIHPDAPGFGTLLWDSIKTTAVFGGAITGAVPAVAGGLATTLVVAPEAGFVIGYAVGAAVLGSISATLFSVPFAIAASQTRKFKSNTYIQSRVDEISSFTNKYDQQYIIDQIIQKDNDLSWWSIRSYESFMLMSKLKSEANLEEKWAALTIYMNEKSNSDAFVHNGKKLFNAILEISAEDEFQLRKAIQDDEVNTVKQIIESDPQLNLADSYGMTPLHRAAYNGSENVINYLINVKNTVKDARIYCPKHANHNKTALYLAIERNHPNNENQLRYSESAYTDTLLLAAKNGDKNIVEYLVGNQKNNLNLNARSNHHSRTAVQWADAKGHSDIAGYLVEHGAIDHDVIQLKAELKEFIGIINHPGWEQQGWSIFENHIPRGVKELQKQYPLNTWNTIDGLSRDEIFKTAASLKNFAATLGEGGGPNTKILYPMIKNLGKNTKRDFDQLDIFRLKRIEPTQESQRKFNIN